jgi:hypothetical protein
MIDFNGLDVVNKIGKLPRIREVAVVQKKTRLGNVRVCVNVIYPARVEGTSPADKAMDLVSLAQKEFSKITAILPGNACDQSALHPVLQRF